jgi:beta-glucosidase
LSFAATVIAQAPADKSSNQPNSEIERRVDGLLAQMSTGEKISLISGTGFGTRGIPHLGIPALKMTDGPYGVRGGPSNAYMGGIGLAATWNVSLAKQVGEQMGRDARARGSSFQLAPGVNIYRSPINGRNFEYFGEDPFLAGQFASNFIQGIQQEHVIATVKHYVANDSEFDRNHLNAIVDERTLREIYLPAFEASVKEGRVGAVMDAYNLVNGQHMTENRTLNVSVLKENWGFPFLVVSDWGATHSVLGAANGGLDLEMPSGANFNERNLQPLLDNGQLTTATIDDKVRRILRTEITFGLIGSTKEQPNIPLLNEQGQATALETAREGIVLLRNVSGILPLSARDTRSIAVIGPESHPTPLGGGGSSQVNAYSATSILQGLADALGPTKPVYSDRGIPSLARVAHETKWTQDSKGDEPGVLYEEFDPSNLTTPVSKAIERSIDHGALLDMLAMSASDTGLDFGAVAKPRKVVYRWTGYFNATTSGIYDVFIQQSSDGDDTGFRVSCDDEQITNEWQYPRAIVEQLHLNLSAGTHKFVFESHAREVFNAPLFRVGIRKKGEWVTPEALELASRADTVVVAVGFDPTTEFEGWDRTFELPPGQEELIKDLAARNKRIIVVLTGGGNVDMSSWIDKVQGLLMAWYPGEQGGKALAEIILGATNPSGHLPATFERALSDNPTFKSYYPAAGSLDVTYSEGVFVGYRGYQAKSIEPRFPFGFGLSYTDFRFKNMKVVPDGLTGHYKVLVDITNVGSRAGKAVPQLYVAPPSSTVKRPKEELKGFDKVELSPGETRTLAMKLDPRSFSYYDIDRKAWIVPPGRYEIGIGSSVEDIQLSAPITLSNELIAQ